MNNTNAFPPNALFGRLRSELKLKLILLLALNLWIWVPYQLLQSHQFFNATEMTQGFLDRLIPFSDRAVWLYLSIYLLMPIGPFLMQKREQIVRYALGIVCIGAIADFVFVFWPTSCPRPEIEGTIPLYRMLIAVDNPYHACPSLHAAFAVYSALCSGQVLRVLPWRCGLWFWALAILWATLATKQHMAIDIAAGGLLGFGVYICVYNQWNPRLKTKMPVQLSTQASTNPAQPL